MPIILQQTDEGWIIPVKVLPKGGKNGFVPLQESDEAIKIKVTAPPEKGQANQAVIQLISKALDLPKQAVVLLSGETSRQKRFLIQAPWLPDECRHRLAQATSSPSEWFEVHPR